MSDLLLPADRPRRIDLNDEGGACPPEPLPTPCRLSYLALLAYSGQYDAAWHALDALCNRFGTPQALPAVNHCSTNFSAFRLTWERHTEPARYNFMARARGDAISFCEYNLNDNITAFVEANDLAALRLRSQATVEGPSVISDTNYVLRLVGFPAKILTAARIAVNAESAMETSIAIVAALMAPGVQARSPAARSDRPRWRDE